MIFVSVGTERFPYPRLVDAAALLQRAEVVVQHGPALPPAGVARAEPFLPFDEVARLMAEADAVVTHAGVGSVLLAIQNGHTPVVMPRLHRFGEHVDDHQLELARALDELDSVIGLWDSDDIAAAVARVPPRRAPGEQTANRLHHALRRALGGEALT